MSEVETMAGRDWATCDVWSTPGVYLGRERDSSHLFSHLLSSTVFILARLMSFLCSLMLNLLGMRLEVRSCYDSFNYLDNDGTDCRIRLELNSWLKRMWNSNNKLICRFENWRLLNHVIAWLRDNLFHLSYSLVFERFTIGKAFALLKCNYKPINFDLIRM